MVLSNCYLQVILQVAEVSQHIEQYCSCIEGLHHPRAVLRRGILRLGIGEQFLYVVLDIGTCNLRVLDGVSADALGLDLEFEALMPPTFTDHALPF
jgi:hypothetical protein